MKNPLSYYTQAIQTQSQYTPQPITIAVLLTGNLGDVDYSFIDFAIWQL